MLISALIEVMNFRSSFSLNSKKESLSKNVNKEKNHRQWAILVHESASNCGSIQEDESLSNFYYIFINLPAQRMPPVALTFSHSDA